MSNKGFARHHIGINKHKGKLSKENTPHFFMEEIFYIYLQKTHLMYSMHHNHLISAKRSHPDKNIYELNLIVYSFPHPHKAK